VLAVIGETLPPRVLVPNPRITEVLTPAGTERRFEELAALADDDQEGFADASRRHGIEFRLDSPWIPRLKGRYGLR
jgi:hypothetical protein